MLTRPLPSKGFTLLELMITISILSILVLTATVLFQGHVTKARRSEAVRTLLAMQLAEERHRSHNAQYGNLTDIWGSTTTESGRYTLSVSGTTATSYTLTATASGNQAKDKEDGTSCSALSISVSSGTETKTPAACWTN